MIRTTFVLPEPLHQQLVILSKQKETSISKVLRELLAKALEFEAAHTRRRAYKAMDEMMGICKDGPTDASATIDDVLYGEEGVWRGSEK